LPKAARQDDALQQLSGDSKRCQYRWSHRHIAAHHHHRQPYPRQQYAKHLKNGEHHKHQR